VILCARWSTTGVLRFHGHHYALEGARPGPKPAHPIGIWHGGVKPRALARTERKADLLGCPTHEVPTSDRRNRDADADRRRGSPGTPGSLEIRRIYNAPGAFSATAAARAQAEPVTATAAETSQ
jgi:hypothetical protein